MNTRINYTVFQENVVHGPLEVLLTMTEEAGMDGAFGLQSNWLQADILINIKSQSGSHCRRPGNGMCRLIKKFFQAWHLI